MSTQKQYAVRVPNKDYFGVVCGIRFYGGEALIASHTISPYLGWTIPEIVEKMRKDFGYEVTEIADEPTQVSAPKAKRKTTKKDVTK